MSTKCTTSTYGRSAARTMPSAVTPASPTCTWINAKRSSRLSEKSSPKNSRSNTAPCSSSEQGCPHPQATSCPNQSEKTEKIWSEACFPRLRGQADRNAALFVELLRRGKIQSVQRNRPANSFRGDILQPVVNQRISHRENQAAVLPYENVLRLLRRKRLGPHPVTQIPVGIPRGTLLFRRRLIRGPAVLRLRRRRTLVRIHRNRHIKSAINKRNHEA